MNGIVKDTSRSKIRWRSDGSDGKKLTPRNHTRFVHGTPNPYAVYAIYKLLPFCEMVLTSHTPAFSALVLLRPNGNRPQFE